MSELLQIQSAAEVSLGVIRLKFTRPPMASDSSAAHDALNVAQYTLAGPGATLIREVVRVRGDVRAVDILLTNNLTPGTWTLGVSSNIQAVDETPLTGSSSVVFTVTNLALLESVNKGAVTDTAADTLRKHLNPVLKGKVWDALIEALATGDQKNLDNARLAFDQLTMAGASGSYLTERAGDHGVARPLNLGMADNTFRKFAIRTTNSKLTEESLLQILEVFYGTEAVMGYVQSSAAEPFLLEDGDDLTVLVDNTELVTTSFNEDEHGDIGQATAAEVCAALNRSFRLNESAAYALPYFDPETGYTYVRIYSGSRGLASSVQLRGGKAMASFLFPELLATHSVNPSWNITLDPATDRLRFEPNSVFDMSLVREGDIVCVYGTFGTLFDPANIGSYEIVKVHKSYTGGVTLVQYFEVINRNGVDQVGLAQADVFDLVVFRPTRGTVHNTPERAVIVSSIGDEVSVVLPATSGVVNREELLAAYLQVNDAVLIAPTTLIREKTGVVTITTDGPHGVEAGDQVYVDGVYPQFTAPAVTNNAPGTCDVSKASLWSAETAPTGGRTDGCSTLLGDGRALFVGGDDYGGGVGIVSTAWLFTITGYADAGNGPVVTYTAATTNPLPAARIGGAMTTGTANSGVNLSGKALFTGGSSNYTSTSANTYIFTPATNTWASAGAMNQARWGHEIGVISFGLNAGNVLVCGGQNNPLGGTLATVEMYTPSSNSWATKAAMSQARCDHGSAMLSNGLWLIAGGRVVNGAAFPPESYLYDDTDMATAGLPLSTCETYSADTNTWTSVGRMSYARFGHAMVVLPDNRVLAIGGYGYRANYKVGTLPTPIRDVEIYDPGTGAWSPAGRLAYNRETPLAYLRADGKVVVTGGKSSTKTEIFDPATMRWSIGAGENDLRPFAVGVQMANDVVVMFGGYNPATGLVSTSIRVYVPNNDTFATGRALNGIFKVTDAPTSTKLLVETPDCKTYTKNANLTSATVTPIGANE